MSEQRRSSRASWSGASAHAGLPWLELWLKFLESYERQRGITLHARRPSPTESPEGDA